MSLGLRRGRQDLLHYGLPPCALFSMHFFRHFFDLPGVVDVPFVDRKRYSLRDLDRIIGFDDVKPISNIGIVICTIPRKD